LNYERWKAAVTIDGRWATAVAIDDDRLAMAIDDDPWTALDGGLDDP
jgi:hypothetical protein